ncbi:CHAP domain-containing protein, partial [Klebsiella pneumoniae]
CDTFVSFVAIRTGATDLIDRECGVERHKDIFKSKGIWLGLVRPQVGDVIIFNWSGNRQGWGNHIGYVASVTGDRITTIEGNTTVNGQSTVA